MAIYCAKRLWNDAHDPMCAPVDNHPLIVEDDVLVVRILRDRVVGVGRGQRLAHHDRLLVNDRRLRRQRRADERANARADDRADRAADDRSQPWPSERSLAANVVPARGWFPGRCERPHPAVRHRERRQGNKRARTRVSHVHGGGLSNGLSRPDGRREAEGRRRGRNRARLRQPGLRRARRLGCDLVRISAGSRRGSGGETGRGDRACRVWR